MSSGVSLPGQFPYSNEDGDRSDQTTPVEFERSRSIERSLIARLQQGDSDAFSKVIVQYTDRLTRFAYYITRSRDMADDIVQRVFIELWERRATFNPDRLTPYLFRAVRSRSLDECSAAKVRSRYQTTTLAEVAAGTIPAIGGNPEDRILTHTTIQSAVEQLSDRRRQAIRLRFEDEMTHAEIAEVLEISPVAVQHLVIRALADLRKILKQNPRKKK